MTFDLPFLFILIAWGVARLHFNAKKIFICDSNYLRDLLTYLTFTKIKEVK